MRRIFLLILIISTSFGAFAQKGRKQRQAEKRAHINSLIRQEEEGVISYNKSFVFGAKFINDGYGVFFELGRASSVKKSLLYQLEISERKHIKEDKQSNPFLNSIPFIYGKENFFYPVKLGLQQQILLGNKSNKNGVSITANYGGGLSLGLLRPYYVQVQKGNDLIYVKYDSPDSSLFLNGPIYGGPTFSKGWSDITVTPGVYAKTSLRFDYGAYNEIISAIEVGLTGEFYSKKIPLLISNTQRQFFFSGFVAIIFGKRK
ncbi:MAG: hypothetical protein ABJA71_12110 [Ginsengibacter sp.]